jgi:hypothetical protein
MVKPETKVLLPTPPGDGDMTGHCHGSIVESDFTSHVFARFVPEQHPLPVLHAADLRVLQGLGIEARRLNGEGRDRGKPSQLASPRVNIIHPALERGRELS